MYDYPQHIIDLFWSKVDKTSQPNGCWLWTGSIHNGYGRFYYGYQRIFAHRFAYEVSYGIIPEGLFVLHKPPCTNRRCVRHLYLGTQKQNSQDALEAGNWPRMFGDRNGARRHPENLARGDNHPMHLRPEIRPVGNRHGSKLHPESVPKAENHYATILTNEDVITIRLAYSKGEKQSDLARKHHVSTLIIYRIVHRKTWRSIN